jgi:2,5-diketo-D-gluconate reductase A
MDKFSTVMLRTGNLMPVMGLGTWQLSHNTADTVAHALELGYRMIDTSGDYGTQPGVGDGIKLAGLDRESIFVVMKVEETDNAYDSVIANLEEIDLEYADLMLIHRPPTVGAGEELWEGLIQARNEGFVIDIGVSNYSATLIDKLIETSGVVPSVNQIEWDPFGFSDDMMRFCAELDIVIQAYSPLTRGKRLDDHRLAKLSKKYHKSPAQILIRWNLQRGTVPIPKANQKKHLEENLDVFDFEIDKADMKLLRGLNERYSSLGHLPYL